MSKTNGSVPQVPFGKDLFLPSLNPATEPQVGQPLHPAWQKPGPAIPAGLLEYRGVSPGAKLLYVLLRWHARATGYCWASRATLARELGMTPRQVTRYISALRIDRLIAIGTSPGYGNLFSLLPHPCFEGQLRVPTNDTRADRSVHPPLTDLSRGSRHKGPGGVDIKVHQTTKVKILKRSGVSGLNDHTPAPRATEDVSRVRVRSEKRTSRPQSVYEETIQNLQKKNQPG